MKRLRQTLRMVLNEPTFFHGYRWLAWGLAVIPLVLPGFSPEERAFHAWLWVFVGVLNVLATALAQSYVRVARRRPAIMGLDLLASVALVWVSGGSAMAFLPYAFASLVLPTMLFGWRGGVFASVLLVLFDQTALWAAYQQGDVRRMAVGTDALIQAVLPFVFVFGLVWLLYLTRQAAAYKPPVAHGLADRPLFPPSVRPDSGLTQRRGPRFTPPVNAPRRPFEPALADTPVVAPLAMLRKSDPSIEEWRRTLIALTSSTTAELPAALDLLASGFGKRSGVEVRTTVVGRAQIVSRSQYLTLLRLAQEALLNVQQHAHAHHVVLTLHYEPSRLTLTVEDDGVGLLDGTYERPGVHALRALAYRLAELDGTLEVADAEQGLVVRGIVPLQYDTLEL